MLAFLSPPRASDIIWLAPIKRRATHISTRVSSIFLLISEEIGMYSGLYVNCVCVCECVCVCVCFVFCESWISEPVTGSPFWIPPNSLAKVACSAAIVCPPPPPIHSVGFLCAVRIYYCWQAISNTPMKIQRLIQTRFRFCVSRFFTCFE
jgi:hypothetical protein